MRGNVAVCAGLSHHCWQQTVLKYSMMGDAGVSLTENSAPARPGRSRGLLFTAARMFTEQRFGPDAVEHCLRQLDEADQAILRSLIPMGWYPLDPTVRFMHALDELYGAGDLRLCREVGMFSAEWQLTVLHRFVLWLKPVEWLMHRGMTNWRQSHDTGRWETEQVARNHIVGRLYDFAIVDAAWCIRFTGFLEKALMLTGVRNIDIQETRCRARGDECCKFVGRWE